MFKNFTKLAFRNLIKNKMFSFISIFGLSLAIGCLTVPFIFIDSCNRIDKFHENIDDVFLVEMLVNRSGDTQILCPTPVPLGPSLKEDFPQIKSSVRIRNANGTFRYQDKVFKEEFLFVDEAFLDMFTFSLEAGEKEALKDISAIIISDRYADKYFGDENPIGKKIVVSHGEDFKQPFIVKGIVEKNPVESSIQFDILLPYERRLDWGVEDLNDWSVWTWATFIQLENPEEIDIIKSTMDKYITLQNKANLDWLASSFIFEPLSDISKNAYKVRGAIGMGSNPVGFISLSMLGIIILALACFNYVNIAIVASTRRFMEIGIRKVLGCTKMKLIVQFLGENILLSLLAAIVGGLLAKIYILPGFNSTLDLQLRMDFSENYRLWLFFGFIFLFTGISSGCFPALFISRIKPINILRKMQKVGGGSRFTKVLLSFQFVLTFILIGSVFVFIQHAKYLRSIDLGYNPDQVICIRTDGKEQFEIYKNEISQNPDIISVAGSRHHVGGLHVIDVAEVEGNKFEITEFFVGYNYLETMELRLNEGRFFNKSLPSDLDEPIIINEKFAANRMWKQPIGKRVIIDNAVYHIIGVVKNFHYEDFEEPIEPVCFRLCEKDEFAYITIRVSAGTMAQTAAYLEKNWKALFPDRPYDGILQDDIRTSYYLEGERMNKILSFLALVALLISCMGLFGLISVNIVKRMKEISIRKIHGASTTNISSLFIKGLIKTVILSSIIAAPVCFLLSSQLLTNVYQYHTQITVFPFIFAGLLITVTSLLTVITQITKAAKSNPIDTLRIE